MYSSCEGKANSSLLFASRHFLLAIFPSIISASSRLDNLVGGKAEKYGTKFFRYLLLYLPWYSFLLFLSFLYVFIRSILFFFLSFFPCLFSPIVVTAFMTEYIYLTTSADSPSGLQTLSLKGFSTIGTTRRWQACRVYASAAFTTGVIPGTVKRLSRSQSHRATGRLKSMTLLGFELATFRLAAWCL